ADDPAHDFENVGPGPGRIRVEIEVAVRVVEPAEIVEADVGPAREVLPRQVFERAVADSLARHRAQPVLGRSQRFAQFSTKIEYDREDRGEPADRPGQI